MCEVCIEGAGVDRAMPITAEMEQTADLIAELYETQPSGMPLHSVLDDFNVEDTHLHCYEGHRSEVTADEWKVAERIVGLMRPMTVQQRVAAIALSDGYFDEG